MRHSVSWGTVVPCAVVVMLATFAHASITGFNNGSGWSSKSKGSFSPVFSSNSVQLTQNLVNANATSVWFDQKQSLGSFTASFTYTASSTDSLPADGVTLAFQNAGTTALGFTGGCLGYCGISPSAAVELNLFNLPSAGAARGTAFATNGNTGSYISTSPLNLLGNSIGVRITYDSKGQTLQETLTDSIAHTSFSHTYTGVDLATTVGSPDAYVGFTGGTGGGSSTQTVSNFSFTSAATPEPSSLMLLGSGLVGMAGIIRRKLRT